MARRMIIKYGIMLFLTIAFVSCDSGRHFYYPFTKENNDIIRTVYSNGKVSCGGGYCLEVDTTISSPESYKIIGGPRLRIGNIEVIVNSKNGGTEFDVKINASLLFKNKEFESRLLDEITSELFNKNENSLNQYLKQLNEEESKKR